MVISLFWVLFLDRQILCSVLAIKIFFQQIIITITIFMNWVCLLHQMFDVCLAMGAATVRIGSYMWDSRWRPSFQFTVFKRPFISELQDRTLWTEDAIYYLTHMTLTCLHSCDHCETNCFLCFTVENWKFWTLYVAQLEITGM